MTIRTLLKDAKKETILAIIFDVIAATCTGLSSYSLALFLQTAIAEDYVHCFMWLLIELALYSFSGLTQFLYNREINKIRQIGLFNYKSYIYKNILNTTGTIDSKSYLSAINNDANQIDNGILLFFESLNGFLYAIIAFVLLITFHWILAVTSICILLLNLLLSNYLKKRAQIYENKRSKILEDFLSFTTDRIEGFSVWNLYTSKYKLYSLLMNRTKDYEQDRNAINNSESLVDLYSYEVNMFGQIVLEFVAVILVMNRFVMIGSLLSVGNLSGLFSNYIQMSINSLSKYMGIKPILEKRTKSIQEENTSIISVPSYDIEISKLSFQFDDKVIFKDRNFSFLYGDKILITGPSGYGKTTLLNLISKKLNYQNGDIKIGGISYSELNEYTLHHYIGYIEQSPYIFKDTLKNNITLYNEYTDEEIKTAISNALVNEFYSFEDINQMIDPDELSGGQKQRIALARELIADHEVILFDESINALDSKLAYAIIKQLIKLPQTIIFVSHSDDKSIKNQFNQIIDISTKQKN